MEQTKHTPGPWTMRTNVTGNKHMPHAIDAPSTEQANRSVCVAWVGSEGPSAALIAAAPDLLAALQALTIAPNSPANIQRALDAIAKATGQQ